MGVCLLHCMLWTCDSASLDFSVLFLGDIKTRYHVNGWGTWRLHTNYCSSCVPCWSWGSSITLLGSSICTYGARSHVSIASHCHLSFKLWPLRTWVPFGLSICMFATVCLLDPLSVKSLILTVHLRSCLTTGCLDQISLESDYSCVFKGFALLFSKSWIVQWFSRVDSSGFIWP